MSDINKIINAKRILYEKILLKLEIKANENMIGGSRETNNHNLKLSDFTNEIKIIGTVKLPSATDSEKINMRITKLSLPQIVSLEESYKLL